MAKSFNLTAAVTLAGPNNIGPFVQGLKNKLSNIVVPVGLKISTTAGKNLASINTQAKNLNANLASLTANATRATTALNSLGGAANAFNTMSKGVATVAANAAKATKQVNNVATATQRASSEMAEFGRVSGLAVRRFAGFSLAAGSIFGMVNALKAGVSEAIDFERQLIRIAQVNNTTLAGVSGLAKEITRLSTSLGVSSKEIVEVAEILAQAGYSANDAKIALEALTKTRLSPTFGDIKDTTDAAIASMAQFKIQAVDLEAALGSMNRVAADFAVESDDIVAAIKRAGAAFAATSQGTAAPLEQLNQFMAVFTSVRATTRESAETIATGLRTIFTRIQRPETINMLRKMGIELQDAEGKFVGAYEAVNRLGEAMSKLDPRDMRYFAVAEELGGYRQIGKVLPLLQQTEVRMKALMSAQLGKNSLDKDAILAQESLANRITKVKEEFLAFMRSISETSTFKKLVDLTLGLASNFIKLADAVKPVLPYLAMIGAVKAVGIGHQFFSGFTKGIKGGGGVGAVTQNVIASASGAGATATAARAATQAAALTTNTSALSQLTYAVSSLTVAVQNNNFRKGMPYPVGAATPLRPKAFARGGSVPGSGNTDSVPAMLQPGEFVLRKSAAQAIGHDTLSGWNKYANGGIAKENSIGVVYLKPPGDYGSFPLNIGSKKYDVRLQGMSPKEAKITNKNIVLGLQDIINKTSVGLGGPQLSSAVSGKNLIKGLDLSSISGNLFEGVLSNINSSGIFSEVADRKRPFDFTSGLVGKAARMFDRMSGVSYIDAKHNKSLATPTNIGRKIRNQALLDGGKPISGISQKGEIDAKLAAFVGENPKFGWVSRALKAGFKGAAITRFKESRGLATGGSIGGSDTVPAMLTPGEFVINRASAQKIGYGNLHKINKYADGGVVQHFETGGITLPQGFKSHGPVSISQDVYKRIAAKLENQVGTLDRSSAEFKSAMYYASVRYKKSGDVQQAASTGVFAYNQIVKRASQQQQQSTAATKQLTTATQQAAVTVKQVATTGGGGFMSRMKGRFGKLAEHGGMATLMAGGYLASQSSTAAQMVGQGMMGAQSGAMIGGMVGGVPGAVIGGVVGGVGGVAGAYVESKRIEASAKVAEIDEDLAKTTIKLNEKLQATTVNFSELSDIFKQRQSLIGDRARGMVDVMNNESVFGKLASNFGQSGNTFEDLVSQKAKTNMGWAGTFWQGLKRGTQWVTPYEGASRNERRFEEQATRQVMQQLSPLIAPDTDANTIAYQKMIMAGQDPSKLMSPYQGATFALQFGDKEQKKELTEAITNENEYEMIRLTHIIFRVSEEFKKFHGHIIKAKETSTALNKFNNSVQILDSAFVKMGAQIDASMSRFGDSMQEVDMLFAQGAGQYVGKPVPTTNVFENITGFSSQDIQSAAKNLGANEQTLQYFKDLKTLQDEVIPEAMKAGADGGNLRNKLINNDKVKNLPMFNELFELLAKDKSNNTLQSEALADELMKAMQTMVNSSVAGDAIGKAQKAYTDIMQKMNTVNAQYIESQKRIIDRNLQISSLRVEHDNMIASMQNRPISYNERIGDYNKQFDVLGTGKFINNPQSIADEIIKLQKDAGSLNGDKLRDNATKQEQLIKTLALLSTDTRRLAAVQEEVARLQKEKDATRDFTRGLISADPQQRYHMMQQLSAINAVRSGQGVANNRQLELAYGGFDLVKGGMTPEAVEKLGAALQAQANRINRLGNLPIFARGAQAGAPDKLVGQFKQFSDTMTTAITASNSIETTRTTQAIKAAETAIVEQLRSNQATVGGVGKASGGWIPGRGNRDTVPAMLTPGEFVVRRDAAQANAGLLEGINGYASGGFVKMRQAKINTLRWNALPRENGVDVNDVGTFSRQEARQRQVDRIRAAEQRRLARYDYEDAFGDNRNEDGKLGELLSSRSPIWMNDKDAVERHKRERQYKRDEYMSPEAAAKRRAEFGPITPTTLTGYASDADMKRPLTANLNLPKQGVFNPWGNVDDARKQVGVGQRVKPFANAASAAVSGIGRGIGRAYGYVQSEIEKDRRSDSQRELDEWFARDKNFADDSPDNTYEDQLERIDKLINSGMSIASAHRYGTLPSHTELLEKRAEGYKNIEARMLEKYGPTHTESYKYIDESGEEKHISNSEVRTLRAKYGDDRKTWEHSKGRRSGDNQFIPKYNIKDLMEFERRGKTGYNYKNTDTPLWAFLESVEANPITQVGEAGVQSVVGGAQGVIGTALTAGAYAIGQKEAAESLWGDSVAGFKTAKASGNIAGRLSEVKNFEWTTGRYRADYGGNKGAEQRMLEFDTVRNQGYGTALELRRAEQSATLRESGQDTLAGIYDTANIVTDTAAGAALSSKHGSALISRLGPPTSNLELPTVVSRASASASAKKAFASTNKAFAWAKKALTSVRTSGGKLSITSDTLSLDKRQGYDSGGQVDSVPAMLTPGEFVVNRRAAQANMGLLQHINNARGYVNGGTAGTPSGGGANFAIFGVLAQALTLFTSNANKLAESLNIPSTITIQGQMQHTVTIVGGDAIGNAVVDKIAGAIQEKIGNQTAQMFNPDRSLKDNTQWGGAAYA